MHWLNAIDCHYYSVHLFPVLRLLLRSKHGCYYRVHLIQASNYLYWMLHYIRCPCAHVDLLIFFHYEDPRPELCCHHQLKQDECHLDWKLLHKLGPAKENGFSINSQNGAKRVGRIFRNIIIDWYVPFTRVKLSSKILQNWLQVWYERPQKLDRKFIDISSSKMAFRWSSLQLS